MAAAKLTKKELDDLRARLLEEKAELEDQLTTIVDEAFAATQSELAGDVGLDDESADAGTATFEREKDLSIENDVRDLAHEIDRALKRMDDQDLRRLRDLREADREGTDQGAPVRRSLHQGRAGAVTPVAVTRGARGATILFATAAGIWGLDRLTKLWVEGALAGRPPITVIPGVLDLRFTLDSGGAFSIGQSAPWFFAGATIVVSALIVATAWRHTSSLTAAALGLILGGAIGNLTDRVVRGPRLTGKVIDFIDFHVWPVFNFADSAIVVGAILLTISSVRTTDRANHPATDRATDRAHDPANDAAAAREPRGGTGDVP